jgi:flavin reductase (DIM6/NTAB) family NADH-FMN oxidoreductase RutF
VNRLSSRVRTALKPLLLGRHNFPQQVTVGLREPQSDVSVWLHGVGNAYDVTHTHLMACGAPFTLGIGGDAVQTELAGKNRLSLKFRECNGEQRLLGEIGLKFASTFNIGTQRLSLFQVSSYKNYCLPKHQLWARYLQYTRQTGRPQDRDVPITSREARAMIVFYLCPRPVVLVSVGDGSSGNMFPMNLMGPIGNGYFAFALNSGRAATAVVERAGTVALSSVPLECAPRAFELGHNHRKSCIDWSALPFGTTKSKALGVPVPEFALRVRELQVDVSRRIGSHTLFVAHTIQDERKADGLEFFVTHGIYQTLLARSSRH